jgi:hypothetical protein
MMNPISAFTISAFRLPPDLKFQLSQFQLCACEASPPMRPMRPTLPSKALWLRFDSGYIEDREIAYPFAVKIAIGRICEPTTPSGHFRGSPLCVF